MVYLDTTLTLEEERTIEEFLQINKLTISLVYVTELEKISGVTNPNKIIFVGGLYLCEQKHEPNEWYMGQEISGKFDFWGNYGQLKDALNGL